MKNRNSVCQGLPAARLGLDEGVLPAQDDRNGFRLNEGQGLHALLEQGLRDVGVDARVREGSD